LYRKYRPARFSDVVGQEHVTGPLSTALGAGRINHAYLFSGPRGCGKTSSARILARSLNCELGPTAEPCGVCPSCVSLAPGGPGNIDVTELDAASHGGVDDTRELRDRAFFAPAESRYRVFIVDEAHMITTQGFNALLKIVEEPPEHLVFVFATTEPEKVLPTIRSRTHHYPFRLIPPGTLRGLLERICAEEGAVVAPPVFPLVIRAGGGSARDSLSVLDQLLAGAGPEGVTYERAVGLLGVTDVALIDDVVDALAAGDRAAVFEAVDRMVEAGHDPRRFATDLLQRLRDLTLLQAVPEAPARGLVDAAEDELARMAEQADKLGPATLTRYGEILHAGLTEMRGATAPRLLLELLCARMLLPAAAASEPALLERIERMERRVAIAPGGVAPPAEAPEEPRPAARRPARPEPAKEPREEPAAVERPAAAPAPPAAPPAAQEPPAAGALDAAAVRRVWPEVLAAAKQRSRSTEALLVNATVRAVDGDQLLLTIESAPLARRLSEQRNTDVIAEALHAVLGVRWRVRCEHGGADSPPPTNPRSTPQAQPPPPAAARSPRTPPARRQPGAEDGVPLPPEPPPDEAPPDDEESMIAEAAEARAEPAVRRDPEEVAIELLSSQLGARAIER
jgi:DNA polymerase-3 subunit gamma/tau